jgi:5-hydroxyisourate hydrolase-like protein (transthyretin family)
VVGGLSHWLDLPLHHRWDFTGRLGGKVTDENGLPVPGVRLQISRRRSAVPPQTLTATTNEQGEYRFDGLAANPRTDKGEEHWCRVEFIPPTVPPLYVREGGGSFWAVSGQEKKMDFVLGHGYALQGTVRDEEGEPVVRARMMRIFITDGRPSPDFVNRTDEQGTFRLVMKPGDEKHPIEVWPPWEANLLPAHLGTVDFSNSRVTERHVVLVKGGTIEGVLREADGQPVEDFVVSTSISLPKELHVGYSKRPSAVTDEQGRFRIVGLPTGTYQVQAQIVDHFRFRSQTGGEQVPVRQGEVTPVEIVVK